VCDGRLGCTRCVVFTARRLTKSVRCPGRAACGLCVPCMSDHVECVRRRVADPWSTCVARWHSHPAVVLWWYKKINETWSGRNLGGVILLLHSFHFPARTLCSLLQARRTIVQETIQQLASEPVRYRHWNHDCAIEWAMAAGGKGGDGAASGVKEGATVV
jgi:hypothetical protein